MTYSRARLLGTAAAIASVVILAACSSDAATTPSLTETPEVVPTALSADTPEGRPAEAPTVASSPSPVPETPTAVATSGIGFQPEQLTQGGTTVVYLNEPAVSATLTFGGRQYAMAQGGGRWWAVIGVGAFTAPGTAPVTVSYVPSSGAAARTASKSVTITDHEYPISYITLDPGTASLLAPDIVNTEIAQRASIFAGYTAQKLWSGPFQRPAGGPLSDRYGEARSYNGAPATDYHKGTDFVGNTGDPVSAVAAGRVVFAGALKVRGNTVIVDHGLGVFSAYHHLSAIKVNQGDTVAPGQRIGDIGATGLVTGPHLHFEIIVRGVEVDAEYWLSGLAIGP
jgi:murein DD-endopeptidase MepM/ murein hydrolase activator NlpD